MIIGEVGRYPEHPGFQRSILLKGGYIGKCFDKRIMCQVLYIISISDQTVQVRFQLVLKFDKQGLKCIDIAGYSQFEDVFLFHLIH